jgi:hypothetical protein
MTQKEFISCVTSLRANERCFFETNWAWRFSAARPERLALVRLVVGGLLNDEQFYARFR